MSLNEREQEEFDANLASEGKAREKLLKLQDDSRRAAREKEALHVNFNEADADDA